MDKITLIGNDGETIEGTEIASLVIHGTFDGIEDPEILVIGDEQQNLYPLLYDTETQDYTFIENEELLNATTDALEVLMDEDEPIEE